ncbi:hypothetical protein FEZ18_04460 [Oceanihabitans sp. IOP_32]|uniref:CUB domain-containing protein n=1 Tax=Oceanihabitans sp. IOP_32 TaxID=2529032 RepID=UPI001293544C|nr:CUB domain-containing protein [Oceanihabitans sp. IOP_32]QFZ54111.1 hypothetical protein FEZ18_04460 [Oceanihabitans sp. IOP_32]
MKKSYANHMFKTIATVLIAVLFFVFPVIVNAQSFTASDGFDNLSIVFTGNMSGSNWANNSWIRDGANGNTQDVNATGNPLRSCDLPGNVLELKDNDAGAYRLIDLSAATSATLNFDYDTQNNFDGGETLLIQIDPENDGTYTTLLTINGVSGGINAAQNESISIPATYLGGSLTRIRFITGAANINQNNERWWLDNIEVAVNTYKIDAVNGQTITTCSGTFYDSGGSDGTYSNDENYSVAFTSSNGNPIQIDFTTWSVENHSTCGWYGLLIYDGVDSNAPLIGRYCNSSPGTVRSSNSSNTLYFEFYSDYSIVEAGWEATISCVVDPCDPIASGNLDTDGDGISDICDLDNDNDGILDVDELDCTPLVLNWENHFVEGGSSETSGDDPTVTTAAPPLVFDGVSLSLARTTNATGNWRINSRFTSYGYTSFQNAIAGGETAHDFTFSRAVNNLAFTVYDVDTGGHFTDEITFEIISNGVAYNLRPTDYNILGTSISYIGNNTFRGGGTDENFELNLTVPVEKLIIYHKQGKVNQVGTGNQGVAFGDFSFCVPKDTDGDGTPDYLDTDSDGDGCPDAIEGDGSYTYSDIDNYGKLTGTVNQNGVPNNGANQGIGTSKDAAINACCDATTSGYPDIDNDGVADICDLDNDNDGILDTVENGGFNSGDINLLGNFGVGNLDNADNGVKTTSITGLNATYIFTENGTSISTRNASGTSEQGPMFSFNRSGTASIDIVFSELISGAYFKLTDFDASEVITVEVYDQNNDIINIEAGNYSTLGSSINNTGNVFTDNGTGWNVDGDSVSDDAIGSVIFNFSGQLISRIRVSANLTGNAAIRLTEIKDFYRVLDTDGDGIPDYLDNDSDGDGCPDAIEGNGSYTYSDIDNYGKLTGTVNQNGVPNNGANQGIGTSKDAAINACCDATTSGYPDIDNDGVADICDLDNDNDGILDVDEQNCGAITIIDDFNAPLWNYGTGNGGDASGSGTLQGVPFTMAFSVNNGTKLFTSTNKYTSNSTLGHGGNPGSLLLSGPDESITLVFDAPITVIIGFDHLDGNADGWLFSTPADRVVSLGVGHEIQGTGEINGVNYITGSQPNNLTVSYFEWVNITTLTITTTGSNGTTIGLNSITSYCDTDGDGIPDYLDNDSDNDGCFDANEAYGNPNADADGNGTYGSGTLTVANGEINSDGTVVQASYAYTPENLNNVKTALRFNPGTTPDAVINVRSGDALVLSSNATADRATAYQTTAPFAPIYGTPGNANAGLQYAWTFNDGTGPVSIGGNSPTLDLGTVSLSDAGEYVLTITHSNHVCANETITSVVTVRRSLLITNPHIYQRVKNN